MYQESSLDVFISASLQYPELSAVRYEANQETLILEAALQGTLEPSEQDAFCQLVTSAVRLFHRLRGSEPGRMSLDYRPYLEGVTLLRYQRDSRTISEEETELFVGLLRDRYPVQLYRDDTLTTVEESFKKQVKRNLIKKINQEKTRPNSFLSYREGGRLVVFNK